MRQEYYYPKIVPNGYRWHMHYKCQLAIGREPCMSCDAGDETVVGFNPPLTVEEKILVDAIFADPATVLLLPTPTGTVFRIVDLYEHLQNIQDSLGFGKMEIWFSREDAGDPTRPDYIFLHFPGLYMTNQQKKTVQDKYLSLITVKSG